MINEALKAGGGLGVENLSARYFSKENDVLVFEDVSFTIEPGKILAIFGPNGCGKSTLLKVVAGLKSADEGNINYFGKPIEKDDRSLIPQDFRSSFFNWCNLNTNIALTQKKPLKNFRLYSDKLEALRQEFGVEIDLKLRPHECSGGMLQQAALLRAFVSSPRILLADEPFSALDVNVSGRIRRNFVNKVRQDKTVVIAVMHNIEEIIEIADYVLAIPNMPYSSKEIPSHAKVEYLKNNNPNKGKKFEENNFVSIARNILESSSL